MRNGAIDIYKFLFSWSIVLYHFYSKTSKYFPHGNIGVEFFVLVSGIYFFMSWEKAKSQKIHKSLIFYPYEYIKKRFLRFFPYTLTAFIGTFTVVGLFIQKFHKDSIFSFICRLFDYLWEILLIGRNGMMANNFLNGPTWTISAMLITEFVIVCILVFEEKAFYTLICPLSILFIYGYWRHTESAYNAAWIGFTTFGVLRVFALTCLAYYCYRMARKLEHILFTQSGVLILSACEASCFLIIALIILSRSNISIRFAGTLFLCIGCTITISGKSLSTRVFPDSKLSRYLGELSFSIYLTHWTVYKWFCFRFPNPNELNSHTYLFLFAVIIVSVIFFPIVKLISKFASQLWNWVRPNLIQSYM